MSADVGHDLVVTGGERIVGRLRPSTLEEQAHRVLTNLEGLDPPALLSPEGEWDAAGGQHANARTPGRDGVDETSGGAQDMLAVVEKKQRMAPLQVGQNLGVLVVAVGGRHPDRASDC